MCLEIRNFKLNMILKVSSAKIELELNKQEKADIKWGFFHAVLRIFTSPLILTES